MNQLHLKTKVLSLIRVTHLARYQGFFGWLGLLTLILWNLDGQAIWWDEGWTLGVAQSWVQHGYYGRLLGGYPAPPGLEANFWVTWPVSLSFRMFGIGIWQGRLFSAICTWFSCFTLFYLTKHIYNRRIALFALVVLFLPLDYELNLFFVGRQVLAEMPMFAYLLLGYLCLFFSLRGSFLWTLPTSLLFALSLVSKIQARPFWLIAMLVPLAIAVIHRNWSLSSRWLVVLGSTFASITFLHFIQDAIIAGRTSNPSTMTGLYTVTAFVLDLEIRKTVLIVLLVFGLPHVVALMVAGHNWVRGRWMQLTDAIVYTRISLLVLASSWITWYGLLSVGMPRYLFQSLLFSSIFVAAFIYDTTHGFQLEPTLQKLTKQIKSGQLLRATFVPLLLFGAIFLAAMFVKNTAYQLINSDKSRDVAAVAEYLNTLPGKPLVETYESELMFLLRQPYHFPPDQVHVETNRRTLLNQVTAPVNYDPLVANPDYLVVGDFAGRSRLYQPAIDAGSFRLIEQFGSYKVYQRVRR